MMACTSIGEVNGYLRVSSRSPQNLSRDTPEEAKVG
jgi:hypothetical protein